MIQAQHNKAIPIAFVRELLIVAIALAIYLPGLVSPPHLMDDVDAAEAVQARNMLVSGDWVTQRLNGTLYLDKAPLKYWMTAGLYGIFGVHDWVTRIPTVVAVVLLCWLTAHIGGFYPGLVLATSVGLFLFTRTIIPDALLTLLITVALWCFFRLLESERTERRWRLGMYAALAGAVLTKGFVGLVLPVLAALVYALFMRHELPWRRVLSIEGILLFAVMAAPWHVLAMIRNPPVFDFTLHPGPHFGGQFRGFFWFYFINEQALRFLNQRWPRDYNTTPRLWFYAYHVLWFFPWSLYLPGLMKMKFSRLQRLALCWMAAVMLFFTFSTTQEYYSMPLYPALALVLGAAMAAETAWTKWVLKFAGAVCCSLAAALTAILILIWRLPARGDIFSALRQHPELYTLSLGHMADLTLPAFAYLRLPLAMAAAALLGGGLGAFFLKPQRAYLALAFMLVVFFQAARLALVAFDPYLSSYAVAEELKRLPAGELIICGKYNPLSSLFFYGQDGVMQNEADLDILEYGSLAPGTPKIELSDGELAQRWNSARRVYVVAKAGKLAQLSRVLGVTANQARFSSGDKYLFANQP